MRILLHLAGKVEPAMVDYRPTPKQRSTLQLLQYMATMGPTQLTVIQLEACGCDELGTMNRWGGMDMPARK